MRLAAALEIEALYCLLERFHGIVVLEDFLKIKSLHKRLLFALLCDIAVRECSTALLGVPADARCDHPAVTQLATNKRISSLSGFRYGSVNSPPCDQIGPGE